MYTYNIGALIAQTDGGFLSFYGASDIGSDKWKLSFGVTTLNSDGTRSSAVVGIFDAVVEVNEQLRFSNLFIYLHKNGERGAIFKSTKDRKIPLYAIKFCAIEKDTITIEYVEQKEYAAQTRERTIPTEDDMR